MADNVLLNDADIAFGSRDITIGSTVYPTEDFKYEIPINRIVSTSSKNVARGKVIIPTGEMTGSFTCILPTSSTVPPKFGDAFTTTISGTSTACHIESVGRAETKGGEIKFACTFSKDIGTVVVT